MFKKSRSDVVTPTYLDTAPARKSDGAPSVLGPTLVIRGELSAEEDLVIEGRIEGSIRHHQKNLTIGRQGQVSADIRAKVITVEGVVEGNLCGDEAVIIKSTGNVVGDIKGPRVVLEDGANFNGRIEMVPVSEASPFADVDDVDDTDLPDVAYDSA